MMLEAIAWFGGTIVIAVCAGLALRDSGYERGYAEGHTRGVWDMTPWDCGCGCRNPPNRAMCGACGADRIYPPPSQFNETPTTKG